MACFLESCSKCEIVKKCLVFSAVTKNKLHMSPASSMSHDTEDPPASIKNIYRQ